MKVLNTMAMAYFCSFPVFQHLQPKKHGNLSKYDVEPFHIWTSGVPEHLTVDHEEMKRFKKFEKELPNPIPDADFEKFNPLQSQQLQKELVRESRSPKLV